MATEVDICNLALSRLGDEANVASISPAEGSDQSDHCARFYPLALDTILSQHAWVFTLKRDRLAEVEEENLGRFRHSYALPPSCMKVLRIEPTGHRFHPDGVPFEVIGQTLNTNEPSAICLYQQRVSDPSKFPALFVDALAWLLASYLAGSIIQGDAAVTMANNCQQRYAQCLAQARTYDASQFNDRDFIDNYIGDIARSRF